MKNIPESLLQRLKYNEATAQKFNEIETRILSILDFNNFFENLLTAIATTFQIPHVWISIIEESPITEHLKSMKVSNQLKANICFVSQQAFTNITGNKIKPLLANTQTARFSPLLPQTANYSIGSIAVSPISLDGTVVGSLNQADRNILRYQPGIDTSLLQHLALKISLCLSNVTAHEQLKFLAYHDPLTALLNRRVMEKILAREFERSKRYQTELTVAFMDLDKFKTINDTFGHDLGDEVLIHTAKALTQTSRQSDIVARFAGDEFVTILPSTDSVACQQYLERVMDYLKENLVETTEGPIHIQMSAGMASALESNIKSWEKLLKKADERLYLVKQNKNRHKKANTN